MTGARLRRPRRAPERRQVDPGQRDRRRPGRDRLERPQTTRRAIRGVATDVAAGWQLVLVDLPGRAATPRRAHRAHAAPGRARARRLGRGAVRRQRRAGRRPGRPLHRQGAARAPAPRRPSSARSTRSTGSAATRPPRCSPTTAEMDGVDEVFPISARKGDGLEPLIDELGRARPRGPVPVPAGAALGPAERGAAGRADPRAGPEPHPRGDAPRGRGPGLRDRAPRGRPRRGPRPDLGRDRVPEGDPDRQGRRQDRGDRHRGPRASSSASSAPGSSSTSRSGSASAGAATRTCSTASGSSSR